MTRFNDPNESTHRWAGFTVLEFLVVMAVIAIPDWNHAGA